MNDDDSTAERRIRRVDSLLTQQFEKAATTSPWKRWLMTLLISGGVISGSCWAGTEISIDTPFGGAHWHGEEDHDLTGKE